MANKLATEKKVTVISMLAESGKLSIRSIEGALRASITQHDHESGHPCRNSLQSHHG